MTKMDEIKNDDTYDIKNNKALMKNIIFLLFISISFISFTQESYDFSSAIPIGENVIQTVDEKYFGIYSADNNETFYEFNADGVWIISTIFSAISRETIRESSKYTVRNGYIFGIVADDSLPCVLEGELYHFGMRNKDQLIGPNSSHVLKQINSTTFIISFSENGGYTPSIFSFLGNKLSVQHFDYEMGTNLFSTIKNQTSKTVNGLNFIQLSPTLAEWKQISVLNIYGNSQFYVK